MRNRLDVLEYEAAPAALSHEVPGAQNARHLEIPEERVLVLEGFDLSP
jgi:hypothetical protein